VRGKAGDVRRASEDRGEFSFHYSHGDYSSRLYAQLDSGTVECHGEEVSKTYRWEGDIGSRRPRLDTASPWSSL